MNLVISTSLGRSKIKTQNSKFKNLKNNAPRPASKTDCSSTQLASDPNQSQSGKMENLPADPFNRVEERSLINLVPDHVQAAFMKSYQARPELFGLSEAELIKAGDIGERGCGAMTNAIRMKFWFEYDEAQAEHRPMKIKNVFAGICEKEIFIQKVLTNPVRVAWLLCRPMEYDASMSEMHQYALSRMRKVLEQEVYLHGKYNHAVAMDQIKIFELLEIRVKGAVVQKTMNIHANIPQKGAIPEDVKKEELEKRLKEIERSIESRQGKVINASPLQLEQGGALPERGI